MTTPNGLLWVLGCVLALAGCMQPHQIAAPDRLPTDLPPSLAQLEEILPAGREVCQKLGLDPGIPGRCNSSAVLEMSLRQTDRSLWFALTHTGPLPGTCPRPIDFSRYTGAPEPTTILCGQPMNLPPASEDDLATFRSLVDRLNATQRKTLAQHIAAVELKQEIACQTGAATVGCD